MKMKMANMGFLWSLLFSTLSLAMARDMTAKSAFRNIMYFTG